MSKLPFSLESIRKRKLETHFIPVTEELLLVTNDITPKHPEALPTVEKLYNALEMHGGEPGLVLPKKYGYTVAEDESIREMSGERDKIVLELRELMEEVCTKTGVEPSDAQNMIFNPWAHQNNKVIYELTPRIVKLIQKLNATDTRKAEVTVFMQTRSKTTDWNEFDTLALNVTLFDAIYNYIDRDRNGWEQPEIEEVVGELTEENPSNNSENQLLEQKREGKTKALAGTTST